MKKCYFKFIKLFSLLLIAAVIQSCSKSEKIKLYGVSEDNLPLLNANENCYIMRVGHAQTEDSARHKSLLYFKEKVEKASDGNIKIMVYPNGILGDEAEMTIAVSEGDLEAVRGGDLEFVPKIIQLGLPMIADTLDEVHQLCYSAPVTKMLEIAAVSNLYVLAVGDDGGFRQITNNVRPIVRPEDMKGLKIRAPQIPTTVMFIDELGAEATVIPFTKLYKALKDGVVDGQENPFALIDSSDFYEVQKYCTLINWQFFPELMYVNLSWWKSLPEEYQKILSDCARDMMQENARITEADNEEFIKHIQEGGCQITVLTPEQRAAFKPYAEAVWKKYIDEGYATKNDLNEMLEKIGKKIK